jgi:hypothetical protein
MVSQEAIVDVDVYSEQGLLAHQRVHMTRSSEPLEIAATDSFRGLVTLHAYRLNADVDRYNQYGGSPKYVLYPEDRELKLKLTGLRTSYLPGAEVVAGLDLRAAAGLAAPGVLGISIFDTAVDQRAATEQEANDRWFSTSWWQDSSGVAGVSRSSLDKTVMAQPVPRTCNSRQRQSFNPASFDASSSNMTTMTTCAMNTAPPCRRV